MYQCRPLGYLNINSSVANSPLEAYAHAKYHVLSHQKGIYWYNDSLNYCLLRKRINFMFISY